MKLGGVKQTKWEREEFLETSVSTLSGQGYSSGGRGTTESLRSRETGFEKHRIPGGYQQ